MGCCRQRGAFASPGARSTAVPCFVNRAVQGCSLPASRSHLRPLPTARLCSRHRYHSVVFG